MPVQEVPWTVITGRAHMEVRISSATSAVTSTVVATVYTNSSHRHNNLSSLPTLQHLSPAIHSSFPHNPQFFPSANSPASDLPFNISNHMAPSPPPPYLTSPPPPYPVPPTQVGMNHYAGPPHPSLSYQTGSGPAHFQNSHRHITAPMQTPPQQQFLPTQGFPLQNSTLASGLSQPPLPMGQGLPQQAQAEALPTRQHLSPAFHSSAPTQPTIAVGQVPPQQAKTESLSTLQHLSPAFHSGTPEQHSISVGQGLPQQA